MTRYPIRTRMALYAVHATAWCACRALTSCENYVRTIPGVTNVVTCLVVTRLGETRQFGIYAAVSGWLTPAELAKRGTNE